jgi:hypothetical protein
MNGSSARSPSIRSPASPTYRSGEPFDMLLYNTRGTLDVRTQDTLMTTSPKTKAQLLATMQRERAQWNALLAEIGAT